jgi:hypothetical protein
MDNTNETTTTQQNDLALIETAIAAAKERKARKPAASQEERAAAAAQKLADREAKRAAREAARAARPARKAAHLSKVEKAAAALPTLSSDATRIFNVVTAELAGPDLISLARHLEHHLRVQRTLAATANTEAPAIGTTVTITGGDPRYIGLSGTVDRINRIRCYVSVPGRAKPVYLFTSDVSPA